MIAEYLKALEERDSNNLRLFLNDVLNGGCIPKEWKERRVVLVTRVEARKSQFNYTIQYNICLFPHVVI